MNDCTFNLGLQINGIRVRKHDSIGDGQLIPYKKLKAIDYKYEILAEGGHLSKSPDFWGELSDQPSKRKVRHKITMTEAILILGNQQRGRRIGQ